MFKKFLKIGFKRPDLLGLGESPPRRSATPLELFFDLAFVVALAHLMSTLEGHLTFWTLLYVILKFITIFIFWNGITMYNQYFEDNTIIHRCIIFFAMFPILMISIEGDVIESKTLIIYTISFMLSRIYLLFIWFWASYKLDNEYLKKIVKTYNIKNFISLGLASAALVTLLFNNYLFWMIFWVIALLVEIVYPVIKIVKINKNVDFSDPKIPVFDRYLQMERSTLFTILILGEGLVGTAHFMNEFFLGDFSSILSIIVLMLITFMILWIYMDYYSSYTVNLDYFLHLNYLNIFQTLGSFLIISGVITLFDHPGYISQFIIALGLFFFSFTNIIIDKHRGEFIYEKYEYSDRSFQGENFDFINVRKSFYLNIIISFVLIVFPLGQFVVSGIVIMMLFINIVLLVRMWVTYL